MVNIFYTCKNTEQSIKIHENNVEYYNPTYYLTPEGRTNHFDASSDVWAFGIILFELMTLSTPYPNLHPKEIIEIMKHSPPTLPVEFNVCFLDSPPKCNDSDLSHDSTAINYYFYKNLVDLFVLCTDPVPSKRPSLSLIYHSLVSNTNIYQLLSLSLSTQSIQLLSSSGNPRSYFFSFSLLLDFSFPFFSFPFPSASLFFLFLLSPSPLPPCICISLPTPHFTSLLPFSLLPLSSTFPPPSLAL